MRTPLLHKAPRSWRRLLLLHHRHRQLGAGRAEGMRLERPGVNAQESSAMTPGRSRRMPSALPAPS
eukprot:3865223-Prorocentrum_lima.AAC.1